MSIHQLSNKNNKVAIILIIISHVWKLQCGQKKNNAILQLFKCMEYFSIHQAVNI
jgi:hypothetical protein